MAAEVAEVAPAYPPEQIEIDDNPRRFSQLISRVSGS
jgi:hypothetical protein